MHAPLRRIALVSHVLLIVLLAIATLAAGITPTLLCVAAAVVAPLLIALHALVTRRHGAERWLAVLLVPYAGALCVEVVARAGTAPLLSTGLLICVLELGVLLALIRSGRAPAVRE